MLVDQEEYYTLRIELLEKERQIDFLEKERQIDISKILEREKEIIEKERQIDFLKEKILSLSKNDQKDVKYSTREYSTC